MIAFPGQVIVTPVMITPSSHDEPLTSQNSSGFWKPLTSHLENNLSSAHCLPGNIQINLPVAKFVVFGKDNVPSRFNLILRMRLNASCHDCLLPDHEQGQGPPPPDLVLTFQRCIQLFSRRKRKAIMIHSIQAHSASSSGQSENYHPM